MCETVTSERPVDINEFSGEVRQEVQRIKNQVRSDRLPISRRITSDRIVDGLSEDVNK